MDFYTDVRRYGNNILFRGINNGKSEQGKVKFQPTLYNKSKNANSEWKSLYGDPLEPKKFADINDAKNYLEKYKDVNGFEVHGMEDYQYQFIAEKYPNKIDYDINQMSIFVVDIEVIDPTGNTPFPDVSEAKVPIVLISVVDKLSGKTWVFGWKDYSKDADDTFEYYNYNYRQRFQVGKKPYSYLLHQRIFCMIGLYKVYLMWRLVFLHFQILLCSLLSLEV